MDIKELKKIIELFEERSLSELEIEKSGVKIRLKKQTGLEHVNHCTTTTISSVPSKPLNKEENKEREGKTASHAILINEKRLNENLIKIESPIVGTFYRKSSPDAEPFVKEGDVVNKGQVMCIIEAMKLMNEIESEVRGRIVSILVENGQAVEFGEPLFLIEPF